MDETTKFRETTRFFTIVSILFWFYLLVFCLLYRNSSINGSFNTTNITTGINKTNNSNFIANNPLVSSITDISSINVNMLNENKDKLSKSINCNLTNFDIIICEDSDTKRTHLEHGIIEKKIIGFFKIYLFYSSF